MATLGNVSAAEAAGSPLPLPVLLSLNKSELLSW